MQVSAELKRMVDDKTLSHDALQATCAGELDQHLQIIATRGQAAKSRLLSLFQNQSTPQPYHGAYIYGPPGRGKTLLLDTLFAMAQCDKRRVHFHDFMHNIHKELAVLRKNEKSQDPLRKLAKNIAAEIQLLCFDEFFVRDIADAMILERLFYALNEFGVHIICTSNWQMQDLYKGGLQRSRFMGFIKYLQDNYQQLTLEQPIDYRLHHADLNVQYDINQRYFTPQDTNGQQQLIAAFHAKRANAPLINEELTIGKRNLLVQRSAKDTAFFVFDELCDHSLGAADYQAICNRYAHIFIDNVPIFAADSKNMTLRFMTLIDIVYESKIAISLFCATMPEELYPQGTLKFEFARTASRLNALCALNASED